MNINFTIHELLRSVIIGIYALLIGHILKIDKVVIFVNSNDNWQLLLTSSVLGSLFYFFYRSVFYYFLYKLVDIKNQSTITAWIRDNSSLNWETASEIAQVIRKEDLKIDKAHYMNLWSSGMHMLYMCGLVNLLYLFAAWNITLFLTGISLLISAYISDRTSEKRIYIYFEELKRSNRNVNKKIMNMIRHLNNLRNNDFRRF